MEVCGTHTMSIAKAGIKKILPPMINLVSGPGCPVCVTPSVMIDAALDLSMREDVILATYGDMIRVPGSVKGDNLLHRMAKGARVEIVFSPADAVEIAKNNPDKEVVFLGVGFETSAPGTAASVMIAKQYGLKNYSVYTMLKLLEPSVKALAKDPDFNIQGFIVPGHVAVILGEDGMKFFERDLHIPAVICGFEAEDIMKTIAMLTKQISEHRAVLENEYTSVVRKEGNPKAMEMIDKYFERSSTVWRGLGTIENSGLTLRPEYSDFDAVKKFDIKLKELGIPTACRCGDVIRGKLDPVLCPMFGKLCVPEDPEGPCMVSAEGACAAAYKYREF